jgi:hypothetical protein
LNTEHIGNSEKLFVKKTFEGGWAYSTSEYMEYQIITDKGVLKLLDEAYEMGIGWGKIRKQNEIKSALNI